MSNIVDCMPAGSTGAQRTAELRQLPAWPLFVVFAGFPVFWVLGLSAFTALLCAVPMALLLWARRTISVPIGFAFWVLFVVWVSIAALQVDEPLRLVGFGVRLSNYVGVSVLFLYVYNASARRLSTRQILIAVLVFFAFVVFGGWLGVLIPDGRLTTPLSMILPGPVLSNEYVGALVRPAFAEIQQPYGSPTVFGRPSAPFPYTNGWGCNVALLVPLLAAAFTGLSKRGRAIVVVLSLAALVPAFATLNRGLYIAIGVGLAYAALRLAVRGKLLPLVALLITAGVGFGVATISGIGQALDQRLQYSETNESRLLIYDEAFRGTLDSPLLGNGSPRPSEYLTISVGTQGQIWNVMFSYGFPALIFFVGWFVWVAWVSRGWTAVADLWIHVCLVVALLTIFYYGYDGPQLSLMMLASALVLRRLRPPEARTATHSVAGSAVAS